LAALFHAFVSVYFASVSLYLYLCVCALELVNKTVDVDILLLPVVENCNLHNITQAQREEQSLVLYGPRSPQHLPVNFVNFSILFLLFLDLLTERIDEFVPLRLPEIAGGSPKALQMPGIDIRNLYEFILHGVQPLCVLILLQLAFSRFFALFPRFLCALSLRC